MTLVKAQYYFESFLGADKERKKPKSFSEIRVPKFPKGLRFGCFFLTICLSNIDLPVSKHCAWAFFS